MSGMLILFAIKQCIAVFNIVDQPMQMTGGGPNGASTVLLKYMYEQGFVNGNFGYAMAISVFSLAISIVLSLISRRLSGSEEVNV